MITVTLTDTECGKLATFYEAESGKIQRARAA